MATRTMHVPEGLPEIMKKFTKSAIRTQPPDILAWSCAYFNALVDGDVMPVKRRLESPGVGGLTPGLLDLVVLLLKGKEEVETKMIEKRWREVGLPVAELRNIFDNGAFFEKANVTHFIAMSCSYMAGGNLTETMRLVCMVMTQDQYDNSTKMSFESFKQVYDYLASIRGEDSQAQAETVLTYLQEEADRQDGMVMPRNFLHPDCPRLL